MSVPDYVKRWSEKFLMSRREYNELIGRSEVERPVKKKEKVKAKEETPPKTEELGQSQFGYVYIVKSASYYKIGMTSRQSGRMSELRGLFPVLRVINQFACNDRGRVESYLHKKYKKKQVTREWYKLDKEDIEWLRSLEDHSLDSV